MPLTDQNISSLSSTLAEALKPPTVPDFTANIGAINAAISDPIGPVIKMTLSSITKLSSNVEAKINKLQEDIINSADNTGKVKLVGNRIVITLEPQEASKAAQYQAKITGSINTVRTNIDRLNKLIKVLNTLVKTAQTLKLALDIQEALLKANPVSYATFLILKKGINILFFKDILNEYVKLLGVELAKNSNILNNLASKFSSLTVEVKVKDANNNGEKLTTDQAQAQIVDEQVAGQGNNQVQDYTNDNGVAYKLTVEKYGERQLIARARDSFSGLLVSETAPSFYQTPDQLLEELKTILNQ